MKSQACAKKRPTLRIIKTIYPTVESEGSLFRMEIGFDHFYYKNLLDTIKKMDPDDRNIALRLIGVEIDLQNISWIIRFKEYYNLTMQDVFSDHYSGRFQDKQCGC